MKCSMKKIFLVFNLILILSEVAFGLGAGEKLRTLPVQDSGRIKPYDSFARETLELIYGKGSFKRDPQGTQKEPAYLIVLSFILAPESWVDIPLFEIKHLDIKAKLGLSADQNHFKGTEIFEKIEFQNLMQELMDQRQSKEKMTPYFQALQRLENQMFVFREMSAGRLLKVVPSKESSSWLSVSQLQGEYQTAFIELSQNYAQRLGELTQVNDKSIAAGLALDQSVEKFQNLVLKDFSQDEYLQKTKEEVLFNDVHPFRWAYLLYLAAALVLLFGWIKNRPALFATVWIFSILGFIIHTLGFAFRIYLSGRAPVTNMYETVVWMSWGAVLFSMILEKIYRFKSLLFAGLIVGLISMIIADSAPAVLDPSLQPLEAVLRSNYWLTVHVMTITISYSAFALAWGLGNMGLFYFARGSGIHQEDIRKIATGVYRSMQIGVAFLAPGIILGGIWADASWGRFWGWDPKETWALIALMGYIIVLHARLVNWIQNFGMIVSGVLTFSLVVMAWYGVNYVLGAGLHSYGFGAGGLEYVSAFLVLQILFVSYVSVVHLGLKHKNN